MVGRIVLGWGGEEVLDRFAAAHPDITLTRLRPGLTFQGDAGSEIRNYFLGDLVPVGALRAGKLPALPVPKGTTLLVGIYSSNRNPALWGADAREWKPGRWLDGKLPDAVTEARIPGVYSNL